MIFIGREIRKINIDEIQESSEIFSMIRQFARDVQTNFIITGSYLGGILGDF